MAKARKSNQKSKRGGKRAGSGRKRDAVRKLRSEYTAQCDELIGPKLADYIGNLDYLANGGYEQVENVRRAAGTLFKEAEATYTDEEGHVQVRTDNVGRPIKVKVKAYPELPDDAMVLVEQRVSIAEPDRAANLELIARLIGRTKQTVEVTGKDGKPIEHAGKLDLKLLPNEVLDAIEQALEGVPESAQAGASTADPSGAMPEVAG